MKGAIIILIITVLTGIILYIFDRRAHRQASQTNNPGSTPEEEKQPFGNNNIEAGNPQPAESGECCGLHLVCEKELTAIAEDKTLYYDDEELDRFAGREPEDYRPEETEEFRDVLFTLLPHDVPGWARSLDRRGIRPPQEIRDELIIMLQELQG